MIHVVIACNKVHILFGIDMMKVNNTKFIDLIKAEENNIRFLRGTGRANI